MLKKGFALLLTILLILSSIPSQGNAQQISGTSDQMLASKNAPPAPLITNKPAKGIQAPTVPKKERKEVESERTPTSKTFDDGDGTYTKEFYSSPIFRMKDKKMQPISTKLVDSPANTEELTTENTNLNVSFLRKMKNGQYVTLEKDGHNLSYSFLGGDGETGSIQATDEKAKVENQNQIFYFNPIPHVAIRNISFNDQVKEDLILDQYAGQNIFQFKVSTDLILKKQVNGQINFTDASGNNIFTIPKPSMSDSNIDPLSGEPSRSDKVDFDIQNNGNSWIIKLTADPNWLKDPLRKYPVYIDPTTGGADTFTSSAYPTTNYKGFWDSSAGYYSLKVGYYDGSTGTNYAYNRFDVSSLNNTIIDSATFSIYTGHSYYPTTPTGVWLDAVNGSWDASTLTWNNQPSSTNISSSSVYQGQWANFDVTSTVQSWSNQTKTNNGFKLHTNGNGQTYWKKFYASENAFNYPLLGVNYHYPSPNTPSGTSYSDGAGSNNTGYVNLNWNAVPGAASYNVWIYNGKDYEAFNVGNVTS
ncbi:MAG: DNRLRE domain-containing protein, partial [Bacillota bacterium]|nr:DNRLRE domain-containing protein [Bacillota bacterium]